MWQCRVALQLIHSGCAGVIVGRAASGKHAAAVEPIRRWRPPRGLPRNQRTPLANFPGPLHALPPLTCPSSCCSSVCCRLAELNSSSAASSMRSAAATSASASSWSARCRALAAAAASCSAAAARASCTAPAHNSTAHHRVAVCGIYRCGYQCQIVCKTTVCI